MSRRREKVPVTEEEMNARCLAASMIKPGDIVVVSGSYGGVAVEVVEIKEIIEEVLSRQSEEGVTCRPTARSALLLCALFRLYRRQECGHGG